MVRLVFRPYTQVRRSICTSESLRTSTRVSSGLVLPRHSSPSFGYQRVCSSSALPAKRSLDGPAVRPTELSRRDPAWATRGRLYFNCAFMGFQAQRLAYMLDSLVRVSRRVGWDADLLTANPHRPFGSLRHRCQRLGNPVGRRLQGLASFQPEPPDVDSVHPSMPVCGAR